METCNICLKRVLEHSYNLRCFACKSRVHLKCLPNVNRNDSLYIDRLENSFFCCLCLCDMFPFYNLENDDFLKTISEFWIKQPLIPFDTLLNQQLCFLPFDFNEKHGNPLHDVDPDIQFYNEHFSKSLQSCDYYLENTFNDKIKQNNISDNSFSMLHVNIRSAPKNLGSLENYLENLDHKFTIIGISESWLKEYNHERNVLDGYNAVHKYRPLRPGGGVSIYTHDSVEYFSRDDLCYQNDVIETVFIEIDKDQIGKDRNVIVGVIYRPPNSDIDLFNKYMSTLLSKMEGERKYISCLGDYNISLLNYDSHIGTQEFVDLLYSNALFPCITKPTRITAKSATLIDNIFCNTLVNDDRAFLGILYTDISDHFPIFYIDGSSIVTKPPKYIKRRIFSEHNIEQFSANMVTKNWSDLFTYNDAQSAYTIFSNYITELFETHFPLRTVKCGYKTRKPWLSDELKKLIRIKNKLYHRKQKSKIPDHEQLYKQFRNKVNKMIISAERQHYDQLLKENQYNLKCSWRIMKDIISHNRSTSVCSRFYADGETNITKDKGVIAENFNSFFVNVGSNLAKKIPPTSQSPTHNMTRNMASMAVLPVSEAEVINIIKNLKCSSPGWDSISAKVVKITYPHFIAPLTHIMSLSITHGIVPKELKLAKVIPLFKSNDPMVFTNYRPVSVLPLFSKILENLMYSRLLSFINKHDLLYSYQFGFRRGHSPELALICLVDKISDALENGEYVLGLFLDFSKAFDTVDHKILFSKLEYLGIRDTSLQWFKSYLDNREQYVIYNDYSSSRKIISCGVPQGSILGPLLFLLYINDLSKVSNTIFTILFADDSNMFVSGKSPNDLVDIMNMEMVKVLNWLQANKLSLNLKKTHFILFRKKRSKVILRKELIINDVPIKMAESTKFLGVMVDQHLAFDKHIKYIKGKVSRGIGILYKATKTLKESTLLTLYYAFVYPYFTYCITVWGNTYSTVLSQLVKCQKRAIRIVNGARKYDHTFPIFQNLKVLNLPRLYLYFLQIFLYKYHQQNLPELFKQFFTVTDSIHDHDTRQRRDFRPPFAKCHPRTSSVRCFGAKINNIMNDSLNYNCSLPTFKYEVRKTLIDMSDDDITRILTP